MPGEQERAEAAESSINISSMIGAPARYY